MKRSIYSVFLSTKNAKISYIVLVLFIVSRPTSPNRQDTDVSKRLTDNPDHKINFDKTEIMAEADHWRQLLITET